MAHYHPPDTSFTPEPGTLVLEDQSLVYGFIQLPKQILWAGNLSRDAKILYAVLLGYAWEQQQCFPGYARLCADLGASENMVRKYMRELEAVDLLSQRRRGLGKTNIYLLHDLRTAKIEVQEPHKPRTSRIEVPEPTKSTAQEPTKSAVKQYTEEQETNNLSNIRKVSTQNNHSGGTGHTHPDTGERSSTQRERSFSTVRSGSTSANGRGRERDNHAPSLAHNPESIGSIIQQQVLASHNINQPEQIVLPRRRGRPTAAEAEARQVLQAYIADFAREFNDQAPLKSSTSWAVNLMQRAGIDLGTLIGRLQEARAITKERTGAIHKLTDKGPGEWAPKNKFAYFKSVAEDLLGLREEVASADTLPSGT